MDVLLQVQKLCAAPYGTALLADIDFRLGPGATLGLVGPNGAGKSSLLHCVAGGLPTRSGTVTLAGEPLNGWQALRRARAVAVQTQHAALNFPFTVEEVILLGRAPHASGYAVDQQVLDEVLQATDTGSLRQRPYTQLSGGEKQRVQLARAVAQIWRAEDAGARLLMLDEPSAALDPAHQRMVMEVVARVAASGCAVIIASHDFNLLASQVDQLLVMRNGHQHAFGSPGEVLTEALFREVFEVPVQVIPHPVSGRPVVIQR